MKLSIGVAGAVALQFEKTQSPQVTLTAARMYGW